MNGTYDQGEVYDGTTSMFTGLVIFAAHVRAGRLTAIGPGRVLVTGGYATTITPVAQMYDDVTKRFHRVSNMNFARVAHSAVALPTGSVFIAGGTDGIKPGEIWQPAVVGDACVSDIECPSGVCGSGFCCAAACTMVCSRCLATTGACATLTSAEDPHSFGVSGGHAPAMLGQTARHPPTSCPRTRGRRPVVAKRLCH